MNTFNTWKEAITFSKRKKNRYSGDLFFTAMIENQRVTLRATSISGIFAYNTNETTKYIFVTEKLHQQITM